jgi:hypothetical protein
MNGVIIGQTRVLLPFHERAKDMALSGYCVDPSQEAGSLPVGQMLYFQQS